ncbi:acyl-CoA synthetase family member 2, mitochondrial [Plakobranchus ocellatus]|uniref:Medium-chain acyl-CoA ligase ACSF2, mitochondrial n=1 Tax=Plakobranchus ocellatus TaxID=259542 RepID=A0AAV3YI77_9GAST|nr:acyl-CoA synthetase family member 2, mitochondrial [Plakobranchus ocellatus]
MADALQTIQEVVRYWSNEKPDAEVFTFVNKHGRCGVYTPREIAKLSQRFASLLRHTYGFKAGDVIANGLPNSPERLITDIGIIMAGCIMVNCQVLEKDGSDLWNTVRVAECKGVILPVSSSSAPYCLFQPLLVPNTSSSSNAQHEQHKGFAFVSTSHAPELTKAVLVNRSSVDGPNPIQHSFLDRLNSMDDPQDLPLGDADDIVVLFATSGSSGFCKLVPRTHREILDAARSFQGAKDARYFSDRPFGWMGGFPFDYLAYCSVRVLQDQYAGEHATHCRDIWSVIGREKCTAAAMVPITLNELIREFQTEKPDFMLPAVVTSGQPLRENLCKALGLITHAMVAAYSSTEAGMVCASLVTSQAQMTDFFSGRPLPGVEIKIVDDEGNEVAKGVDGQVLVKSSRNLKNYYKQPEETKGLFTADGWLQTGDKGWLDEAGNFYCLGRTGDAVLQGSVVIYSSWPEGILAKCPDVLQVSVVVIPKGTGENILCACVVVRPDSDLTEEGLMKFYKESFFGGSTFGTEASNSSPKHPRGFLIELHKILLLQDLPKTQSGKINKKELSSIAKKAVLA